MYNVQFVSLRVYRIGILREYNHHMANKRKKEPKKTFNLRSISARQHRRIKKKYLIIKFTYYNWMFSLELGIFEISLIATQAYIIMSSFSSHRNYRSCFLVKYKHHLLSLIKTIFFFKVIKYDCDYIYHSFCGIYVIDVNNESITIYQKLISNKRVYFWS